MLTHCVRTPVQPGNSSSSDVQHLSSSISLKFWNSSWHWKWNCKIALWWQLRLMEWGFDDIFVFLCVLTCKWWLSMSIFLDVCSSVLIWQSTKCTLHNWNEMIYCRRREDEGQPMLPVHDPDIPHHIQLHSICKIFVKHLWDICEIFVRHLWDICKTFVRHL